MAIEIMAEIPPGASILLTSILSSSMKFVPVKVVGVLDGTLGLWVAVSASPRLDVERFKN